jgi:hypothetical protein
MAVKIELDSVWEKEKLACSVSWCWRIRGKHWVGAQGAAADSVCRWPMTLFRAASGVQQ